MSYRWPERLWIVRHGESAGNVARDAATAAGLPVIDIAERDVDVPLSAAGERQSEALGRWFAAMPEAARPNVVLTSPYLRARHTAAIIEAAGGIEPAAAHPRSTSGCARRSSASSTGSRVSASSSGIPTRPRCARGWASSTTGRRAARAGAT